jgi:hypothetical protein
MASSRETDSHIKPRRIFNWRYVLVLVAVCSLIVNVATRYSVSVGSQVNIAAKHVKDHSQDQTRQRLSKTVTIRVAPVSRLFHNLEVSDFYPRFAPGGPPVQTLFLNNSLYNRPPPSSEHLS